MVATIKHVLLLIVILFFSLNVNAEEFIAGKDYEILDNHEDNKVAKVRVEEFFSYGCPWCYRIDDELAAWIKQQQNKIEFSRVAVIFHQDWLYYAKAYYIAKLLGNESKITPAIFKAVQVDNNLLNSNQQMIDFFVQQGADLAIVKNAFINSPLIDLQVNNAQILMGKLRINGVPAIVVNHKYKTDLQVAGGKYRLFKLLDYLVSKDLKN